jgi:quercetin dioxygenase-like cupin family protein
MKPVLFFLLFISCLSGQTTTEVEITAEPSHHLVAENEYVRVFNVEVAAGTSTLMHRHRHDYVYVTIGDAHISNEVQGKPPADVRLSDGDTRFVPGDFAHAVRDLSEHPFHNVTIELMQDERLRQTPSRWPEEKWEKRFPGGRIETLFVKDGVRVSDVTLLPGAVTEKHHHDGPHLVVALSDLNLRSDVDGKPPVVGTINTGDVKWVPGGFTHTLTNMGKIPARFVTVEF